MNLRWHQNATTTPARRAYLQSSPWSVAARAAALSVSEDPMRRGQGRDTVADRSPTAHRWQTTLTPAQAAVGRARRETRWLPRDELLVVTREVINEPGSRSGRQRLLQRQGRSSRPRETPADTTHAPFTAYEPGYRPVDVNYLPQLAAETTRRDRCVAMDRATRGVCIPIKANKTAASAQSLLAAWHRACPLKIGNRLTDNGQDFTERRCGSREKTASGDHECDQRCQALGIEQRLTPPRRPPTTSMVERFKGRIAAVLAPPRCNSAPDLETPLLRDAGLDNHHLPQQALGQVTPSEAMKKGYAQQPEAFLATPRNRPGPDSYFDGSMSGCGGVTWRNSRSRMPRR